MHSFEFILALLAAVLVSNVIGQRIPKISLPLIQVALGVAMVILPIPFDGGGLDPELFLVLFIAPMLFEEAKRADKPSLWRLRSPVLSLAVGLVFATCLIVGFSMNLMVPSVPLAAGFAMAAALAPTDAVAVFSLKGIATITDEQDHLLGGEALLNDAASIVSFQFAIAAVLTASISLVNVGISFIVMFFGGLILGVVLMAVRYLTMRAVTENGMELTTFYVLFEIITPSLVYLIAELLHVSGIIAVVAAGITYSYSPRGNSPHNARNSIVSSSVWSVVIFSINGLCFLLLGAQLPFIANRIEAVGLVELNYLLFCMVVLLAVILSVRFFWILVMHRNVNLAGGGMAMAGQTLGSEVVQALLDDDSEDESAESQPFTIRFQSNEYEQWTTSRLKRWHEIRQARQRRRETRREAMMIERTLARADSDYWKLHLKDALLLAIGGPKGAITLALIFAIPMVMADGNSFPERDIITLVASGTILISLFFTSFSMPLLSPKIAHELAQEDELNSMIDILNAVAQRIWDNTTPDTLEERFIVDAVTRQYYQRIGRMRAQNNLEDPEETSLRIEMASWEREFLLNSVLRGQIGFTTSLVSLSQLSRQQARLKHIPSIIQNIATLKDLISFHLKHWQNAHNLKKAGATDLNQTPRLRMPLLQLETRKNTLAKLEHLSAELDDLKTKAAYSEQTVNQLIVSTRRQVDRMSGLIDSRVQMRSASAANQAERERREMRLVMQALEWEREAITEARRNEKISTGTAKRMLDSVAIMELDIEELLE